jgi:ketosteroid isomerase-like protein
VSPLEIVQSLCVAFSLLGDRIEWREAEGFPYFGGTWTCPQQVAEGLLLPLGRDWDGFSVSADGFVGEGDEVVAFGAYRGVNRETRRTLFAPFAHRWRVASSRIAAFTQQTDTVLVQAATRA